MAWKLESKKHNTTLCLGENGLPEGWILKKEQGDVFYRGGGAARAILRDKRSGDEAEAELKFQRAEERDGMLSAAFCAVCDGRAAAYISLLYHAEERGFSISWSDVQEQEEYRLLEIVLPSLLCSVAEENPRFLHGENRGGYLSDLEHLDDNSRIRGESRFHGYPNASILPVIALLREDTFGMLEVTGYVCRTLLDVEAETGVRMGVTAPWRLRGGEKTPDILVNQKEIARIEFGMAAEGKEEADWMDVARLVREHFAPLKDDFFDDKFVYIIQNQLGRQQMEMDYVQTEELIRRISNLTGGNPQVAFLTGWSQGGHDTSYPNAYVMNEELGTEEAFQTLKRRGREQYHCTVSLNDNFDDMYDNEYTQGWFREQYIARTRENELETFETWNGTDRSYITGMYQYMKPGEDGERRIRQHGEKHGLKDAILLDALSWWSIRSDWNPESPASAVDNLRAKFRIIDTFYEKYGIHVCSELVRYPFFGRLQLAFDNSVCYDGPGDHDVPFLRAVLRGVMYYGGRGGDDLDVPDMLYHNAAKHPWFRKEESAQRITDIFYLNYVPWFLLNRLEITDYQVQNGRYDIYLEKRSHIHIDYPNGNWYVEYEGARILERERLTCPIGKEKIAFYAHEDCELHVRMPEGAKTAGAYACYEDGRREETVRVEGQSLYVSVKKYVPVIVMLQRDGLKGERKNDQ